MAIAMVVAAVKLRQAPRSPPVRTAPVERVPRVGAIDRDLDDAVAILDGHSASPMVSLSPVGSGSPECGQVGTPPDTGLPNF